MSLLGSFIFWSYTGVLTSLSAIRKYNFPVKSLNDLRGNPNFELFIYRGGYTESFLNNWAGEDKWKMAALTNSISKVDFENNALVKEMKQKLMYGGPNKALVFEDSNALSFFEASKHNKKIFIAFFF